VRVCLGSEKVWESGRVDFFLFLFFFLWREKVNLLVKMCHVIGCLNTDMLNTSIFEKKKKVLYFMDNAVRIQLIYWNAIRYCSNKIKNEIFKLQNYLIFIICY
jgi:hypothetical protein